MKEFTHMRLDNKQFSDEEINKLRPEDINWDLRYMYQLAKMIEPGLALDSVVQSASRGKFKEYI